MTSRLSELSKTPAHDGRCVLYVMSRDQRADDNHALLEAQTEALEHELPLIVVFNLYRGLGERRREHFEFMVEGLKEVEKRLKRMAIPFVLTIGDMPSNVSTLANELLPRSVYFDFSPLRHARAGQKRLADMFDGRVVVVDTHNIVPVWVTSDKEEYAAHTIRRKLHRHIEAWCVEPDRLRKHPYQPEAQIRSASWSDVENVLAGINRNGIDHGFEPGEAAANKALQAFVETGLTRYANGRNDPNRDAQSNLSPYLHYGHISALRVALEVLKHTERPPQLFRSFKMPSFEGDPTADDGADAFLEELIVRRELSDNFCLHNPKYDSLEGAKDWAKESLKKHATDPREFIYDLAQFEAGGTHDELWNAAQHQLRASGKIHGYMRMYWAKKILEWSRSPQEAVATAVLLNDRYHLDGGDPNGYVGVLWSIAGVHDRPWFERDIYGKIRYMSAGGAKTKFDVAAYIERWSKHN
jgi:deoxyribodipyrimidine photo-lyase